MFLVITYDRSVPGTIEEQTRLTLDNIQKCVEAAGGNMGDIFKVVIMLKNPADYKRMPGRETRQIHYDDLCR